MRIYTKSGDQGETGLLGGGRVSKAHPTIELVGSLDEVNNHLGLARSNGTCPVVSETLEWLQSVLFDLGAELASTNDDARFNQSIHSQDVERLEREIDVMTASLPELRNFILPGGHPMAATLHVARGVARRFERLAVQFNEYTPLRPITMQFVNRLSDWLFVAARAANSHFRVEETIWRKRS